MGLIPQFIHKPLFLRNATVAFKAKGSRKAGTLPPPEVSVCSVTHVWEKRTVRSFFKSCNFFQCLNLKLCYLLEYRVDLQLFLLEENGEKLVVQLTIKPILTKEDKECVT